MVKFWRIFGIGGLGVATCLIGSSALAQHSGGGPVEPCSNNVSAYFEARSASPTVAVLELLDYLPQFASGCRLGLIIVVGHSDAAEAQSHPDIGQERADAVAAFLRAAMPEVPIVTEDARYSAPAKPSSTSEPLNRRATIYLR